MWLRLLVSFSWRGTSSARRRVVADRPAVCDCRGVVCDVVGGFCRAGEIRDCDTAACGVADRGVLRRHPKNLACDCCLAIDHQRGTRISASLRGKRQVHLQQSRFARCDAGVAIAERRSARRLSQRAPRRWPDCDSRCGGLDGRRGRNVCAGDRRPETIGRDQMGGRLARPAVFR